MNESLKTIVAGCRMYSRDGVLLEAGVYTRGELEQMILMIEAYGRMNPGQTLTEDKVNDE